MALQFSFQRGLLVDFLQHAFQTMEKSLEEAMEKSLEEALEKSLEEALEKSLEEALEKSLEEIVLRCNYCLELKIIEFKFKNN